MKPRWLALLALSLGVAARLAQYIFNRSLWLDEAYLTLNILERDLAGLLRPLNDNQVAPPAFLLVERLVTWAGGHSEYALRLFPLASGLAALFVFYRLAQSSLGKKNAWLAVALLSWSQPLVYFASEVKPYVSDVLCAVAVYALYLPWLDRKTPPSWRQVAARAAAGALLVWASLPVVFVLAAVGTALALDALASRDRQKMTRWGVLLALWVGSWATLYGLVLRAGLANTFLQSFWGGSFAPFPPRSFSDIYWLAQQFFDFLVQAGGQPFYGLATFMALAGGLAFWQRGRWQLALALALPLGWALVASMLHRYPFFGRMLLFATPSTFLLMAEGARAVYAALAKDSRPMAALLLVVMFFHPFYRTVAVLTQPLTNEEIKPVLQYMQQGWQAGDRLYVYHGSAPAFRYYAARYGFEEGLEGRSEGQSVIRVGRASNGQFGLLSEDVRAMQGGRTWFVFTHVYAFDGISEEPYILDQLNAAWTRLDAFSAPGANVYLYDLR